MFNRNNTAPKNVKRPVSMRILYCRLLASERLRRWFNEINGSPQFCAHTRMLDGCLTPRLSYLCQLQNSE